MKHLTQGELEVMQVLWGNEWLKPAELQAKFPRPIKNAALRSVLLVLLEKEHVIRKKKGKAYFYKARTKQRRTLKSEARRLADAFSKGSTVALIAQLITMENLSDDDIRELKKIASEKSEKGE
jgi:BlaI family transcriptional regulator, penicillinase repressor